MDSVSGGLIVSDGLSIGVDLGWRMNPPKPHRTACLILDDHGRCRAYTLCTTDAEIFHFVQCAVGRAGECDATLRSPPSTSTSASPWPWAASPTSSPDIHCVEANGSAAAAIAIGIDAPIVVTNQESNRQCEKALLRCGYGVYPANRPLLKRLYGGIRGELLARRFAATSATERCFEVYPAPVWSILFGPELPPYKSVPKARKIEGLRVRRERLFDATLQPPLQLDSSPPFASIRDLCLETLSHRALDAVGDILDATVAAYIVYAHQRRPASTVLLGDPATGVILLPATPSLMEEAQRFAERKIAQEERAKGSDTTV